MIIDRRCQFTHEILPLGFECVDTVVLQENSISKVVERSSRENQSKKLSKFRLQAPAGRPLKPINLYSYRVITNTFWQLLELWYQRWDFVLAYGRYEKGSTSSVIAFTYPLSPMQ